MINLKNLMIILRINAAKTPKTAIRMAFPINNTSSLYCIETIISEYTDQLKNLAIGFKSPAFRLNL